MNQFWPLVELQCSSNLRPFLCSLYVPECIPGESLPKQPSKKKCQSARCGCESIMRQYGFAWPSMDCEKLPEDEEADITQVEVPQAAGKRI